MDGINWALRFNTKRSISLGNENGTGENVYNLRFSPKSFTLDPDQKISRQTDK